MWRSFDKVGNMLKFTLLCVELLFVMLCSSIARGSFQRESEATESEHTAAVYDNLGMSEDSENTYKLGLSYYEGKGGSKDYQKAFELFCEAAEAGNARAMYKLYCMFYSGEGVVRDSTKAVEWVRKAAEGGNTDAMASLGLRYYYGEGTKKDYYKAADWCGKAAEAGSSRAMLQLAEMYEEGNGVPKDNDKSKEWYQKAFDACNMDAESGSSNAMYRLGDMYYYGWGTAEDVNEAIIWYTKAANAGDSDAMYELGETYYYGWGVEEDPNRAMEWYAKAFGSYRKDAEAGNSEAARKVAEMYENGEGITKDYAQALEWYRKAAGGGNSDAMHRIGLMYENAKGVHKDYEQAKHWYRKATELSNKESNIRLAVVFVKQYYKLSLYGFLAVLITGGFIFAAKEKSVDKDTEIYRLDRKPREWTMWVSIRRYVGALLIYMIYWLVLWGPIRQVAGSTLSPDKARDLAESGVIESTWDYGWGDHYIWFLITFCFVTFCSGALAGATAKKRGSLVAGIANLPIIVSTSLFYWFFLLASVNVDVESPFAWKIIFPLSILGSIFFSVAGGSAGEKWQNEEFGVKTILGIRSFHWSWLWFISAFYVRGIAIALIPIIEWSSDAYGPGILQIFLVLIYGYPIYLMYRILSGKMLSHKNVFIRMISFVGIYLGGILAAILFDMIRFGLFKLLSSIF